jgi:hypothetical protein
MSAETTRTPSSILVPGETVPGGRRPVLLVRTELDRIFVTVEYAVEVLDGGGRWDELLYLKGDSVRHVEEVTASVLWPPARWWSLCWAADMTRQGRVPPWRTRSATASD